MAKKKNKKKNKVKEQEKSSKLKIIIPLLILAVGFAIGVYFYSNGTDQALTLKEYYRLLANKEYEAMYELVETDISKEDFVTRIKNIYEGIEATDISVTVAANTKNNNQNAEDETINNSDNLNANREKNDKSKITYTVSMECLAGNIKFLNSIDMVKVDGKYKINWDSSMIFPDLHDNEKVKVDTINYTRGSIYDKNGTAIAKEGNIYQVGLVPGKMNETTDINKLASLLDVSAQTINSKLNESYVKDDTFVPLRKISREKQDLKNELLKIKGVMINDYKARVYPYKEATSILTGYVQDGEGKSGLEYAFNDKLKGENGVEVYIAKEDGTKVKTLAKKQVVNGEDIKLTIDVNLQKKIYDNFKEDEGAQVAINYNTGEILALVSTPSYDANDFSIGVTDKEWEELQNNPKKPMYNKYLSTYAPGSSIKPVIGAIGLSNGTFGADDDFGRSGTKWQEDSSWKDLYVTTLETYSGNANLENALVYSDNIYFAKAALKIGKSNLQKGLDSIGFNDKINFPQDISKSSYGSMESSASIANSGYGQSEMLVNPIHLAMIYSGFANGGNIVMPVIEKNQDDEVSYYKENVWSKEIANTIKKDLIQVVERGTAKSCKIEGKTIAGKTGTAEIKESQDDKNGTEIGWFNCFDENGLLIVSMVQNVKDRGGSHYVVEKVKDIIK